MKYILFILSLFGLYGCLSLKSEYPDIKFYGLNQETASFKNIGSLDGILQMREFTAAEQFKTDHLLAQWDDTKIQNYFYHRWITSCPDLITDFLVARFNNHNVFKGGTVKTQTMMVPDFMLEAHILDMMAHNSLKTEEGSNYVTVSIHFNVLKRDPLKADKKIILSKLYSVNVSRINSEAANIPPAFSKAISQISDKLIVDIMDSLAKSDATK